MHKPRAPNSTPPFRPIVSSIGTYNYSLAKYLSNLLQPHIPSTFIASDSFTFVKEINELSLHGMFMVSFDVESLFTNIPLDDCINLAVKYITEGNPGLKLSKQHLKRLFEFATKETHFLFKGNFYDQVDGVAMGSPLAPVLSNLFMGHHENIWLDQYGDSEVLFYRRYVDDTFCLFRSERDATLFFNYINNQHPNIRFTMEREADHVLPFLDVLINNTDPHQSVTTVYRKKTFTGILLAFPARKTKRTLGDRLFSVAAPTLWNKLPRELRDLEDFNSFKQKLKTHLFMEAYS
ncbi:uncharacterized protein [Montipora foliosa]|uniref:uncharacterized protein n=1 Tax=Montipora foliosa TaxID=591990 RepID=UPI0035F10584